MILNLFYYLKDYFIKSLHHPDLSRRGLHAGRVGHASVAVGLLDHRGPRPAGRHLHRLPRALAVQAGLAGTDSGQPPATTLPHIVELIIVPLSHCTAQPSPWQLHQQIQNKHF